MSTRRARFLVATVAAARAAEQREEREANLDYAQDAKRRRLDDLVCDIHALWCAASTTAAATTTTTATSSCSPPAAAVRAETLRIVLGLRTLDHQIDCGTCGWAALAYGHQHMYGGEHHAAEAGLIAGGDAMALRMQTATWLQTPDGRHLFEPCWRHCLNWTVATEDGPVPQTYDTWVFALVRSRRWLCGLAAAAVAFSLGARIYVLNLDNDGLDVYMLDGRRAGGPTDITLAIVQEAAHFKALLSGAPGFAEWSPRCHMLEIPSGREVSLSRATWAAFDRIHGGTHLARVE